MASATLTTAGDDARLQALDAALEQLLATRTAAGTRPVLHLTNRSTSSARGGVWRRPPALFIRRALVDGGDRLALRGELAHELGHVLDPRRWRDVLVGAFACGIPGALAASLFAAELAAAYVLHGEPQWLVSALLGSWLVSLAIALASYRTISHRAEYRADALATALAGTAAVRAWLMSLHVDEQRRGRRPWAATLTHPRTEARLKRLPA